MSDILLYCQCLWLMYGGGILFWWYDYEHTVFLMVLCMPSMRLGGDSIAHRGVGESQLSLMGGRGEVYRSPVWPVNAVFFFSLTLFDLYLLCTFIMHHFKLKQKWSKKLCLFDFVTMSGVKLTLVLNRSDEKVQRNRKKINIFLTVNVVFNWEILFTPKMNYKSKLF